MDPEPVIVEQTFHATPERVWSAITEKDEMKQWYFNLLEFNARPGFEFRFESGPSPDKPYLHICEVKEVVPEAKISYTWRYDGYPGISLVIFELFPEDDGIRLQLTHEGLETFPVSNPDMARENFVAGWNHIIGKSLKEYLEKDPG